MKGKILPSISVISAILLFSFSSFGMRGGGTSELSEPAEAVSKAESKAVPMAVEQSERVLPIAAKVDVIVAGGTTGGVAAALEAAKNGQKVFLFTDRTYLGDDICPTYRYWLKKGEVADDPLAKKALTINSYDSGLDYKYSTDIAPNPEHDDKNNTVLSDGKWQNAASESVQYDGDVNVVVDLGSKKYISGANVMAFMVKGDYDVQSIDIYTSVDKESWTKLKSVDSFDYPKDRFRAAKVSVDIDVDARYLKFEFNKAENAKRILLGEIQIFNDYVSKHGFPRPIHVKSALEQELIANDVKFFFASYPTDVVKDKDGNVCGVIIANRSGRQVILANVIIDATMRGVVARQAGAEFKPYPTGKQIFQRVVLGGEPVKDARVVKSENIKAPVWEPKVEEGKTFDDGAVWITGPLPDWDGTMINYTLEIDMPDGSFQSFAHAEQVARDITFSLDQFDASELLFQVPPDPMIADVNVSEWPGAEKINLGVFKPKGFENIFVVGGCADISREAAAKLLRPTEYIKVGRRVGKLAAEVADQSKVKVVCFGDSITRGKYPQMLQDKLTGYKIIQAGVSGQTTTGAIERFERDVLNNDPDIAIIFFGTNDSVVTDSNEFRTGLDKYEENLRYMIQKCKDNNIQVVLCTLPDIVSEPYFKRHPQKLYDNHGGLEKILLSYRSVVQKLGQEMSLPVVDLYPVFKADYSLLNPDGVHPNVKGHERITEMLLSTNVFEGKDYNVEITKENTNELEKENVRELTYGYRATQFPQSFVKIASKELPVLGNYDVVVVGGGTAGAPAGISAARHGAKTLMVEYQTGLGGVATRGLIGIYYFGYLDGFTGEIDRAIRAMGPKAESPKSDRTNVWNIEYRMEWLRKEFNKAGGELWFQSIGCGAYAEGNTVKGVIVVTPFGRGVVLANKVIDTTGSSDIAIAAGADYVFADSEHAAVQGTGLSFRNIYNTGKHRLHWYANTDYMFVDDTDMKDIWRAYVGAREKFNDQWDSAYLINSRERRRIVGDYTISPLDILNHRIQDDTIYITRSNFDSHGFTVHPVFVLREPDHTMRLGYVPYRSLLPKGMNGILVGGLGMSAHRDAMPILRMEPCMQNQGYAMGYIAAKTSMENIPLREVDISDVREKMFEKGVINKEVMQAKDNYPFSQERVKEAVDNLVHDLYDLEVVLAQPDDALPYLRDAYNKSEGDNKVMYAKVLCELGDDTGFDTLAEYISSTAWDKGWNFRGGGQFGGSVSPLDSKIISLGNSGNPKAVDVVIDKVKQLDENSEFSHYRAVSLVLENFGDEKAAKPLAELIEKPGMTGHTVTIEKIKDDVMSFTTNRSLSLREIILARALYRCGDYNGLGEKILKSYVNDIRGFYSRHAAAVLEEGKE